jgi:hypothetical protein
LATFLKPKSFPLPLPVPPSRSASPRSPSPIYAYASDDSDDTGCPHSDTAAPLSRPQHAFPRRTRAEMQSAETALGQREAKELKEMIERYDVPRRDADRSSSRAKTFDTPLQRMRAIVLLGFYNHMASGLSRTGASEAAAAFVRMGKYNGPRSVRRWGRRWEEHRLLPESQRGSSLQLLSPLLRVRLNCCNIREARQGLLASRRASNRRRDSMPSPLQQVGDQSGKASALSLRSS